VGGLEYLFEGTRVVVSKGTGGKSSGDGGGADVGSKLQDGSLSVGPGTDDDNIGGVLDGCDDTGGKNNFLPGLSNVDDVDAVRTTLPDIGLHGDLQPLSADLLVQRVGGTSQFFEPMWHWAARSMVMSSSVAAHDQ
jgi:hypothetical protein